MNRKNKKRTMVRALAIFMAFLMLLGVLGALLQIISI